MIIQIRNKTLECATLLQCPLNSMSQDDYDKAGPFTIFVREAGYYSYMPLWYAKTFYNLSDKETQKIIKLIQKQPLRILICGICSIMYVLFTSFLLFTSSIELTRLLIIGWILLSVITIAKIMEEA